MGRAARVPRPGRRRVPAPGSTRSSPRPPWPAPSCSTQRPRPPARRRRRVLVRQEPRPGPGGRRDPARQPGRHHAARRGGRADRRRPGAASPPPCPARASRCAQSLSCRCSRPASVAEIIELRPARGRAVARERAVDRPEDRRRHRRRVGHRRPGRASPHGIPTPARTAPARARRTLVGPAALDAEHDMLTRRLDLARAVRPRHRAQPRSPSAPAQRHGSACSPRAPATRSCCARWTTSASTRPRWRPLGLRLIRLGMPFPVDADRAGRADRRPGARCWWSRTRCRSCEGHLKEALYRRAGRAGRRRPPRRGRPAAADAPAARSAPRTSPRALAARHRRRTGCRAAAAAHLDARYAPRRRAAHRAADRSPARTPVLLLGLPAQHLDPHRRRHARRRGHRLPRHGRAGRRAAAAPRSASPRWAARAPSGSAWRRSPTTGTSSRTSATAPSTTPARWPSGRPSRPASP